jgi:hypothetical protein
MQKELGIGRFAPKAIATLKAAVNRPEAIAKKSESLKATMAMQKALGIGRYAPKDNATQSAASTSHDVMLAPWGDKKPRTARNAADAVMLAPWGNKKPRTARNAGPAPEIRAAESPQSSTGSDHFDPMSFLNLEG